MATTSPHKQTAQEKTIPLLYNGDRLTQAEFHRRYEAYPKDVKAELIGGVVYMASPLGRQHGTSHPHLNGVLWLYQAETPGIELLDNATTILGDESEPQPDLALRILPEWGGQSRTTKKNFVLGPPELLAEIAHSTLSIDLRDKKEDYEQAGVMEYLVWCVEEKELHWFNFRSRRRIAPDVQGIFRSRVFPGLWIDSRALRAGHASGLIDVVQQGLASPEHAAFVKRLATGRRRK